MMRIAIIGSPGAGKTTFAKRLAGTLNLPLHHLDYYYYDSNYNYVNDKEAWRVKVKELVSKPSWIIDGNYKSTFDIRFARANTIIFLDYSRWTSLKRAAIRRAVLHNKIRDDMPSNWREKLSPGFVKFIWSYNKTERPKVNKLISSMSRNKKIIVLKNSQEADLFLARLE